MAEQEPTANIQADSDTRTTQADKSKYIVARYSGSVKWSKNLLTNVVQMFDPHDIHQMKLMCTGKTMRAAVFECLPLL